MPQNWKTYKLKDVARVIDSLHKTPKYSDFGYPMVRAQEIIGGRLDISNAIKVSEEVYQDFSKNHKSKRGDLVFSRVGAHSGKISYVDTEEPFCLGQNTAFVIPEKVNNKFLYHLLSSSLIEEQITRNAVISSYKTISLKTLRELDLNLPPLPEQQAVANILSTIDAKIENNLAINKTLEDMAMALYKEWFVDFGPFQDGKFIDSELGMIPEGWEVRRLDEVAYKNSQTFDFSGIDKVVFVNTGDVQYGSFLHKNYSDSEGLPGQAKKVIELNDILYSEIRPKNKRYAYVDFDASDYVVSTKFMIIRNNDLINNRLLYRILTRQESVDEFQMIAESRSGTFPQITFDAIGHFPIVLPSIELQSKFQVIVEGYENQQRNNLKQNQSLTQLRDTLLPKLISGEVRLNEFDLEEVLEG